MLIKRCEYNIYIVHRFSASIMLRIGYGYRINSIDDALLDMINKALIASAINSSIVDIFPIRMYSFKVLTINTKSTFASEILA